MYGAHTSNSCLPSAFKTQWYRNMSDWTQVWLIDEQLNKYALTSHSSEFLGHRSTYVIDISDEEQAIVLTPCIKFWICAKRGKAVYCIHYARKHRQNIMKIIYKQSFDLHNIISNQIRSIQMVGSPCVCR